MGRAVAGHHPRRGRLSGRGDQVRDRRLNGLEGDAEALAALAAAGFDSLDSFFDDGIEPQVIHRRDDGRSVARLELPGLGVCFVKRWRRAGLLPLDGPGRRVCDEAENLQHCAAWGLVVPRVLARGARRGKLGLLRVALVTGQVPGVAVLEHLASRPADLPEICAALGRAFGLLRAQGKSHSSPAAKHVFVVAGSAPEVALIDVARLPRHRPRDLERYELLVRDLGGGETEREAFWSAFFDGAPPPDLEAIAARAARRQLRRERKAEK